MIRKRNQECPYCGQIMTNIRKHFKICTKKRRGHTHTEEEKKLISEKRKQYLKEHPDFEPLMYKHYFRKWDSGERANMVLRT